MDVARDGNGRLWLEAWRNGHYGLKTASGRELTCDVDDVPVGRPIAGPWQVPVSARPSHGHRRRSFWRSSPPGASIRVGGVRHFSGSAVYVKSFTVPTAMIAANRGLYLNLGKVAVIAEVKLNGHSLGVYWKPPFRVEIRGAVRPGENKLEVRVTNLWVNRLIGDEQLPEDWGRNRDSPHAMKEWPQWLKRGEPSPTGRFTFTQWKCWKKDSPLQQSGLLGPVTLEATKRIAVSP